VENNEIVGRVSAQFPCRNPIFGKGIVFYGQKCTSPSQRPMDIMIVQVSGGPDAMDLRGDFVGWTGRSGLGRRFSESQGQHSAESHAAASKRGRGVSAIAVAGHAAASIGKEA
jgi:hypothetical protein